MNFCCDIDAEISLLGAMILDVESLEKGLYYIEPKFFSNELNRDLFIILRAVYEKHKKIDIVLVSSYIKDHEIVEITPAKLSSIINTVPSAAHFDNYFEIVLEKFMRREMQKLSKGMFDESGNNEIEVNNLIQSVKNKLDDLAFDKRQKASVVLCDALKEFIAELKERGENKRSIGIPTGFRELDDMLMGLQRGNLVILAARPSMGKTALVLNILETVVIDNKNPALLFSLEMEQWQVVGRVVSSASNITYSELANARLQPHKYALLAHHIERIQPGKLFINDSAGLDIDEIKLISKHLKTKHDIKIIAIDHLQLITSKKRFDSRHLEISYLTKQLKNLAKELNVCVIVLSQLNRQVDQRADKRPQLSDLRESGSIEEDADAVIMIYRSGYYDKNEDNGGLTEILVCKNRNGKTGAINLYFNKEIMKFEESETNDQAR